MNLIDEDVVLYREEMKTKKRVVGPSKAVTQGARHLAAVGGRQAYLYKCRKAGGVIALESHAERTIAQLADLDPRVIGIRAQPFTIDVLTGRRFETRAELLQAKQERMGEPSAARDYTPDFCLRLVSAEAWMIEGKHPNYPGNAEYQAKVERARELFRACGEHFAVVQVPPELDAPLVYNAALLAAFPRSPLVDVLHLQEVVERVCARGVSTLGDVAAACSMSLRYAPLLLLTGLLSADLTRMPVSARMPVTYAGGDLSSLELLPLTEGVQT